MSEVIALIPIKSVSKRVPRKNFRTFAGHPLYRYIISAAVQAHCFDEIYIDTDSEEIKEYATMLGLRVIDRPGYMTADSVNGNDLLCYQAEAVKNGDVLVQLFATAPLLLPDTISKCVKTLLENRAHDSIFTATEEYGWYWFQGQPVNYRPSILPRSQDAVPLVKESTGLYGIYRSVLTKYRERIGARPYVYLIPRDEALDIDTDFDLAFAESVARQKQIDQRVLTTALTASSVLPLERQEQLAG